MGKQTGIVPKILAGHMAAPRLLHTIDFGIFKKTDAEKGKLMTMKTKNKKERKKAYGADYKDYLNIPLRQINPSLHFTF